MNLLDKDSFLLNKIQGIALLFKEDWVCINEKKEKTRTIRETEYGKKVQPNIYSVWKNMETGETKEIRETSYLAKWVVK